MKNKKKLIRFLGVLTIFTIAALSSATVYASGWSVGNLSSFNLPGGTATEIVKQVANWLVVMFGFFGIIGFMISGIMYLISTGNDEMITKAKTYMLYSIVGIIVGLSGYVIIKVIDTLFRGQSSAF